MTDNGAADSNLIARWEDIPLSLLHAEIQRRQTVGERPACGSTKTSRSYNVPLHVFALFLILFLSTLACSFPLIVRRFPGLSVPKYALFISRHFGTGVLIATAFVHLLPTAYTNLTDPCLPPFWTEVYPAMPGFIAMVSVFVVVGIEMFFAAKGAGHSHNIDFQQLRSDDAGMGLQDVAPVRTRRAGSFNSFRQLPIGEDGLTTNVVMDEEQSPFKDLPATPGSATSSINKPLPPEPQGEDSDLDLDELDPAADDTVPLRRSSFSDEEEDDDVARSTMGSANGQARRAKHNRAISWADQPSVSGPHPHHGHGKPSPAEQRLILQCLMLEAGILFHSVFIGLAVSVSTGSAFVVLLIAIAFHQTFEGLALGSRIASIGSFSLNSVRPWVMCLLYGITTPVGQAIGLGVQGFYDPDSEFGLLMVGIMNAISSGLLLYAGLVQLLAEDFLSDASYKDLKGKKRLQACGAVVAGAFLMALVGVWA